MRPLKLIELTEQDYQQKEQSGVYDMQYAVLQKWFPQHIARILDVGCGQGHLLKRMCTKKEHFFVGVDYSWQSITKASQMLQGLQNVALVYCSAYHLPFRDGCFDVALSTGYQSVATLPGGLTDIVRVLRRKGMLVLDHLRPYNLYSFIDGTFFSLYSQYRKKNKYYFGWLGSRRYYQHHGLDAIKIARIYTAPPFVSRPLFFEKALRRWAGFVLARVLMIQLQKK